MPPTTRSIRHHDITATLGRDGFVANRAPRRAAHQDCGPSCTCRKPARPAAKLTATAEKIARKAVASSGRFDRMSDSLDIVARKLHHATDQRRAILAAEREKAAAPGGIVSATAGFIRDAAGNRIRSMTTADLAAIHRAHYGRAS